MANTTNNEPIISLGPIDEDESFYRSGVAYSQKPPEEHHWDKMELLTLSSLFLFVVLFLSVFYYRQRARLFEDDYTDKLMTGSDSPTAEPKSLSNLGSVQQHVRKSAGGLWNWVLAESPIQKVGLMIDAFLILLIIFLHNPFGGYYYYGPIQHFLAWKSPRAVFEWINTVGEALSFLLPVVLFAVGWHFIFKPQSPSEDPG